MPARLAATSAATPRLRGMCTPSRGRAAPYLLPWLGDAPILRRRLAEPVGEGAPVRDLLFGPVLLTSLLAGVVALLAPCCVSVMLPAYLATVFRRRAGVLAATLVFAVGVATVIVPIGLGASALSAAFQRWHTPIWTVGGAAMLVGGLGVVAGRAPKLPMPAGRPPPGGGIGAVDVLRGVSASASACSAPGLIRGTGLGG